MKILIIIPSYNEADNIVDLVNAVLAIRKDADILVIDDNSPDGTAGLLRKHFASDGRVNLVVRNKKDGRGGAVLNGIAWALERGGYEKIVEMDADFSHDPKEMQLLLDASAKADVVVGSRYLPKSRIINWPVTRRIFSRFANFYARALLGIPINDYTNGYRIYSIGAAKAIDGKSIACKGDIVLSGIAYQLFKKGFSFTEVPIVFVNRRRGQSKLDIKELLNAFYGILRIRFKKPPP